MKTKFFGFTLIQLLMVIIIIAIIASLEIALTTSETSILKIQKSAIQIQQLLQAAMNYHTDNNKWPDSFKTYANYLPVTLNDKYRAIDPWGGAYKLSTNNGELSISITNKNQRALSQIAQLLPNPEITKNTSSTYTLTISVVKNLPGSNIIDIGYVDYDEQIKTNHPNSPIILSPNSITMKQFLGVANLNGRPIRTMDLKTKKCASGICLYSYIDSLNSQYIKIFGGTARALFIVTRGTTS